MARITKQQLGIAFKRAAEAAGWDTTGYFDDNRRTRPGHTFLQKGPCGWNVAQLTNEHGAERNLNGYLASYSAGEMLAFLNGVELGAKAAADRRA